MQTKLLHPLPFAPDAVMKTLTDEQRQHSHYHGEERNPFHQGGHDNHVGTNLAHHFGLTGNGIHGIAANLADADAGSNSRKSGSDSAPIFASPSAASKIPNETMLI